MPTSTPDLFGRASAGNSSLASWTSATALNTVATVLSNNGEYDTVTITLNQTTTITGGQITFQMSEDGANWINALPLQTNFQSQNGIYVLTASTYAAFQFSISGFRYFQVLLSTVIAGTGTVTVGYALQASTAPSRNRTSLSRITTIETSTALGSNGVFTGPWHDAQADGTNFVAIQALANQASAANGLVLQESGDINNASLVQTVAQSSTVANTIGPLQGPIMQRYWRVTYTNGASAQATFELTTTAVNIQVPIVGGNPASARSTLQGGTFGENNKTTTSPQVAALNADALAVITTGWGGAFSGTAQATLQGAVYRRVPTIFKTVSATASGNTAIWTPGSGNKFRLLKLFIQITDNASLAAGAVLTVDIQDSSTTTNITFSVFVPTTAVTTTIGDGAEIQLDLGEFGYLSTAANNVLNVNLSAALSTGVCRVIAMGVEE